MERLQKESKHDNVNLAYDKGNIQKKRRQSRTIKQRDVICMKKKHYKHLTNLQTIERASNLDKASELTTLYKRTTIHH